MTLSKPTNEECGNCYYCVSHMETESRGGGFFSQPETREHEVFECRRSPPLIFFADSTWNGLRFKLHFAIPTTSKIHWCGEWRRRGG